MPKIIKPLTIKQVESKAGSKATNKNPERIADGNGLYIYKYPTSTRTWYSRYKSPNTRSQRTIKIGYYPSISLAQARKKNIEIQEIAKKGEDPNQVLNTKNTLNEFLSFGDIAKTWLEFRKLENRKDEENIRRLNKNILPYIGKDNYLTLDKVTLQTKVLDPIIERQAYSEAKRNKDILVLVFEYAIDKYEVIEVNPAKRLKHPKIEKRHYPALTNSSDVEQLVKDIWNYRDNFSRANIHTHAYLKLSMLLFLRPSDLREIKWDNYNEANQTLSLILSKTRTEHIVPLPRQANDIFLELKDYKFVGVDYVFPTHHTGKNQPLSDAVGRIALNKLGYKDKQSIHGFRATARTLLEEELEENPIYIEYQLGHVTRDPNKGAYNRSKYLKQRGKLLQVWADYLDGLRTA